MRRTLAAELVALPVDVIVTEGFSGNIALKAAEGTAKAALLTSPLVYMAVQEFGSPRHNIEGVHYAGDAMDAAEGHAREAYTAEVGRLAKKADLEWR
jgi:hypothetical protein